jgi:hypothetical protein
MHKTRYGTRRNPQTGKMETYELPAPLDLERSRKEFRDFIQGNIQWHTDPIYKEKEKVIEESHTIEYEDDQYADFLGNYVTGIN